MNTTVVNENCIEAADMPFEVGNPLQVKHLTVETIKALLNPRQCEYRLLFGGFSLGARTETIYKIKAGEEEKPACSYTSETESRNYAVDKDTLMRCFLLSDTVELLECKPFQEKPKPLTCYASFAERDNPVLCVVGRHGGTSFYYQKNKQRCSVIDRDMVKALTTPAGCEFNVVFYSDSGEVEDIVPVGANGSVWPGTDARIAASSFLQPTFAITHIKATA